MATARHARTRRSASPFRRWICVLLPTLMMALALGCSREAFVRDKVYSVLPQIEQDMAEGGLDQAFPPAILNPWVRALDTQKVVARLEIAVDEIPQFRRAGLWMLKAYAPTVTWQTVSSRYSDLSTNLPSVAGGWSCVPMNWVAPGGAGLLLTVVLGCTSRLCVQPVDARTGAVITSARLLDEDRRSPTLCGYLLWNSSGRDTKNWLSMVPSKQTFELRLSGRTSIPAHQVKISATGYHEAQIRIGSRAVDVWSPAGNPVHPGLPYRLCTGTVAHALQSDGVLLIPLGSLTDDFVELSKGNR